LFIAFRKCVTQQTKRQIYIILRIQNNAIFVVSKESYIFELSSKLWDILGIAIHHPLWKTWQVFLNLKLLIGIHEFNVFSYYCYLDFFLFCLSTWINWWKLATWIFLLEMNDLRFSNSRVVFHTGSYRRGNKR